MLSMPGRSFNGPLLPLTQEELEIQKNLATHIQHLANKIGERNIWNYQNLQAAAQYIENHLNHPSYLLNEQTYTVKNCAVKNIIAEYRGTTNPDEIVIVGAHYDTVLGSPGADDNGSGVAAVLELARLLANSEFKRTVRFVAFVNEESPFFYTRKMGSYQYARQAKEKKENIIAMLSIESIGYYSEIKGSQQYPFPFGFFFPNTGDFIGFVSNLRSRFLLRRAIDSFRQHTQFPSEGCAAPSWMVGVGWSDQWAFWRHGYRAIMVTGTALFRNPFYHSENDLPTGIDYARTARVVKGLTYVIADLSEK